MGINWTDIIKTLGGGAVLLAAAGWLIRSIITHQLDRDNAAFRNQLQHDSSIQVEALQNDLKRSSLMSKSNGSRIHFRLRLWSTKSASQCSTPSASKRFQN